MILLAKVFPLSERSAVNVLGSYNVRKCTKTETLDSSSMGSRAGSSGENGSNDLSSAAAAGESAGTDGMSSDDGNSSIGYEFYTTFWGVQKVFTDPPGTILPTQLSHAAAANAYSCFMKDVTTILMALESTPIPKASGTSSTTTTSTVAANAKDDNNALSVRHHRYLTSRQLLHLQLKDAQLRVHFLTQLLIVLSHLASPNVALPVPPPVTSDGSSKAKAQAARVAEQTKQLSQVEKRGMELLHATVSSPSSSGKGALCRFLSWILKDRESMWRAWKRAKCMPVLDKVGNVNISGSAIRDILAGDTKKRKAEAAALDDCAESGKRRLSASSSGEMMIRISSLPDITDQITQSLPTVESFLNPYVEALDPENGIEGEYHPRNDKVYCWRALRLMARDQKFEGQLCRFGKLRRRDGDFEGIVRGMWKAEKGGEEEIGGTMIDAEYYADEIDLTESPNKVSGVSSADNDVEMVDDAASVGTPEEDIEARKEKMAEFERAALEVEENMLNEEEEVKVDAKIEQLDASTAENQVDGATQNAGEESITVVIKDNEAPSNNAPAKTAPKDSKIEETIKRVESSDGKGSVDTKEKASAPVSASNGIDGNSHKGGTQKKEEPKKNESKTSAPARPKFTPPQKKPQQQQPQPQTQKNEPSRAGSRGRFVGKGDNNVDQAPKQQQQQQQQHHQQQQSRIPPPQNHSQRNSGSGGPTHQRGNSANNVGQDSMQRRDGKSQSPPQNKSNDGGPLRGGGGGGSNNKGKGGWEPPPPPPPQGGGGRGTGGGKGGGDGHGGNYRERRHGGGGRR